MHIIVIGGGVIGLSTAYFLTKAGHQVTIIDRGKGTDNCSFGNAGYISPSHFIPLATPGIVAQGLKWMLSATSPFYIKPRWNGALIKWGWQFYKNANEKTVRQNAQHLHTILQLSRNLTIEMDTELNGGFELRQNGCLMLYQNKDTGKHEAEMALEAKKYGIEAPVLTKPEIQKMEPDMELNIIGGVYYPIDCHLHPAKMMSTLSRYLTDTGVNILYQHEVSGFEMSGTKIKSVITDKSKLNADEIVLAPGSWLPEIMQKLNLDLLLQPGKGYSTTYQNLTNNLRHPAILVDERVAMTPLGKDLRIGGTMELAGIQSKKNMNRVTPIVDAANKYFKNLHLSYPNEDDVWTGLRPVTPDGLPYIGRQSAYKNLIVAGGHAMLGISLAAATGLLVSQIVNGENPEIDISAFRVER
ncbi:MAG: FAD-dependent oxidoreductase [Saprospiraceae bacterium]|nr:FAD-dependent oxidoreductase [Saprospiraceae bacterium]